MRRRKRVRTKYRRRPHFSPGLRLLKLSKKATGALLVVAVLVLGCFLVAGNLGQVSGEVALTEANDLVTRRVTDAVNLRIQQGGFDYSDFVRIDRDAAGNVTAITTDTAKINLLSAELLSDIVAANQQNMIEIGIPLGTLTGTQLLLGRGPNIHVKVYMLSNSTATFRNEFSDAGINQTKHQILLDVSVNIRIMIPWKTIKATVNSEVLLAETVIVGKVPETYVKVG
ncbi:MAG: sporulation protein YunB [Firmicutes bacterium]|nr:sporulation protein YunB [Bacillota bacterium]